MSVFISVSMPRSHLICEIIVIIKFSASCGALGNF